MSIDVTGIHYTYGDAPALRGIDLRVESGQLLALLGPSGCGKTTFLRIVAGLEFPQRGSVAFHGRDVTTISAQARRVGFVFQHYALFNHLSVFENVAFGLRVRRWRLRPKRAEITRKVRELLDLVQLGELAARFPAQLSGGQRQRVALARALAVEPEILLLDEPFGALDTRVRTELRRWLRSLHERLHTTGLFVTHDRDEAFELADRIAVMNAGRIEQVADARTLHMQPASPFVCRFLGEVNELPAALHAHWSGIDDPHVTAFVRPHDLDFSSSGDHDAHNQGVRIQSVRDLGASVRVEARHSALAEPLVAVMERDRHAGSGLVAGQPATLVACRSVFFRGDAPVDAPQQADRALRDILTARS